MDTGQEWLIDASGCTPERLRDPTTLSALFDELTQALVLTRVSEPLWHTFPGAGGVTGLCLLAESHLTVHTFPEHRFAALNVYCCRPRPRPDFEGLLARHLGTREVLVRELSRGVRP